MKEKVGNKKPRKIGVFERRRPDLNRCVLVLQTIALPLGYCAILKMTPTGIEPVLPP